MKEREHMVSEEVLYLNVKEIKYGLDSQYNTRAVPPSRLV